MSSARPLHEVLDELVGDADTGRAHGDPEAYLAANGHPDLPADLVAEAVVSYADTAPVEVAEHLAPYVTAHSAVPVEDVSSADWFGLLTTAPAGGLAPEPDIDDLATDDDLWSPEGDPGPGLDFGSGATDVLDAPSISDDVEPEPLPAENTAEAPAPAWADLEPENPALDAIQVGESDAEDTDDLD